MVFKTIISFICGLYRFYPILPNWFYPLGKTTLPTLVISILIISLTVVDIIIVIIIIVIYLLTQLWMLQNECGDELLGRRSSGA